jgi:hypothetical protein
MDEQDLDAFAAEFEAAEMTPDGSAADAMLAKGLPIHIVRPDTPRGLIVRVWPDRREDLIKSPIPTVARAA